MTRRSNPPDFQTRAKYDEQYCFYAVVVYPRQSERFGRAKQRESGSMNVSNQRSDRPGSVISWPLRRVIHSMREID